MTDFRSQLQAALRVLLHGLDPGGAGLAASLCVRKGTHPAPAAEVERQLALSESELDLTRAAIALAAEVEPRLPGTWVLRRMDELALKLSRRLEGVTDPREIVHVVNGFLFRSEGFAAAGPADGLGALEALDIHRLLQRRRGQCVGLSLVYLALTRRLRLPFQGVSCPRHFFVRYDDGQRRINVETTREGLELSDEDYVLRYRLSPAQLERGIFLTSLGPQAILVELLNNRGNAFYQGGRRALALRDFQRARALGRRFAALDGSLGFLYQGLGDAAAAQTAYRQALRHDPGFIMGHCALGDCYLELGRPGRALACYRRALRLKDDLAAAHAGRARALQRLGRADEALEACALAAELDPEAPWVLNNLGTMLWAAGRRREALRAFGRALRLDPGFAVARENRARCHQRLGRNWQARWDAWRAATVSRGLFRPGAESLRRSQAPLAPPLKRGGAAPPAEVSTEAPPAPSEAAADLRQTGCLQALNGRGPA